MDYFLLDIFFIMESLILFFGVKDFKIIVKVIERK